MGTELFSAEERRTLAQAVPDRNWVIEFETDFARNVQCRDWRKLMEDKEKFVSASVSWAFSEAIRENDWRGRLSEDTADAKHIVDLAKQLRRLLKKPNFDRQTFAISFLGISRMGEGQAGELLAHELLESLLDEVIENKEEVLRRLKLTYETDPHKGRHSYVLSKLTSQLLSFWRSWTGTTPGAGWEGGPAARFIRDAVNPCIRQSKQDGRPLRSKLLDEQAAAELIKALQKAARG